MDKLKQLKSVGLVLLGLGLGLIPFFFSPRVENPLGSNGQENSFPAVSTSTNSAVSQGTLVLATSTGRMYAIFVSKSATPIDLALTGNSAADSYTIRLNGTGASYEILPENMYTGSVYASSTSATVLSVTALQ